MSIPYTNEKYRRPVKPLFVYYSDNKRYSDYEIFEGLIKQTMGQVYKENEMYCYIGSKQRENNNRFFQTNGGWTFNKDFGIINYYDYD